MKRGLKGSKSLSNKEKLSKSNIDNRGYNKFLELDVEIRVKINQQKIRESQKWDGLKGYLTNSSLQKDEILENYYHLWEIEKAFRITKSELKLRPVFHYKKRRIEAHICLNFTAYKVFKELDRQLKEKNAIISATKAIEIAQNIYQVEVTTQQKQTIPKALTLTPEQKYLQRLFQF